MKHKNILTIIMIVLSCMCFVGYFLYPKINSDKLNFIMDDIKLLVNDVYKLEFSIPVSYDEIKISSTNKNVVKILNNGSIVALKKGTTTIIAEYKSEITSLTVNVLGEFEFSKKELELQKGSSYKLEMKKDIDGQITYKSSNPKIATVSKDGIVNTLEPGIVKIIAECAGKSIEMNIKVYNPDAKLEFVTNDVKLFVNDTYKLEFNIPISYNEIKISSINKNVVKILNNGSIVALKKGTTTITAEYKKEITSLTVNVLGEFEFSKKELELQKGSSYKLEMKKDIDGQITYKSSNPKIATVSKDGIVNTLEPGIVKIIAECAGKSIEMNIKVYNSYMLTYELNGATSLSKKKDICKTYGEVCEVELASIIRNGGNIIGFSDNPNSRTANYESSAKIQVSNDMTLYAITKKILYAKFYPNSSAIIFGSNDNFINKQEYIETQCTIYNAQSNCAIVSPNNVNSSFDYIEILGYSTNKSDNTARIKQKEEILLTTTTNFYTISKVNNDKKLVPLSEYQFPTNGSVDKKKLKVLVIEIDPILTKGIVDGKNCTGLHTSECLNQDKNKAVSELIDDIKYSSHGNVEVSIVKTEKTNDFSHHTKKVKLLNGQLSNVLDEDTWIELMKDGWFQALSKKLWTDLGSYNFDYEYYINKYNLVNRKNAGEFDEVWIVNIDPSKTFESLMVGKTAYYVNGDPIIKNCSNFKIMNVSISRRDTNYECFGHAAEFILSEVFNYSVFNLYNENYINVNSGNYSNLNLWQKFTLNERANASKNTGLSGAGNVHFSPNSTSDYNWNNYTNKVASKWEEWLNYPNLTNSPSTKIFTPNSYLQKSVSGEKSDARLHHRWWFYLMPHISGVTNDGYSNNWWTYLYSNDYITQINTIKTSYTYNVGDKIIDIKFNSVYKSGKVVTEQLKKYTNNIKISNSSLLRINGNGEMVAKQKGTTTLKYYRDGHYNSVNITIN